MKTNLAKLLVREGIVSLEQIREAAESGEEAGYGLGESLAALGYITETRLVELLSREYGVPSMDIDGCRADESVIRLIPRETALDKFLIPISVEGTDLTIAVSDPSNILMLDDLGFITGKNIKPVVASERSIRNKLEEYYGENGASPPSPGEGGSAEAGSRERPQGDEEPHSSAGQGSGMNFITKPRSEAIDGNMDRLNKPEGDFVFDFTDEKIADSDLPFLRSGEKGGGSGDDTSVNGVRESPGNLESTSPQSGDGFENGGADASGLPSDSVPPDGGGGDAGVVQDALSDEDSEGRFGEPVSEEGVRERAFEASEYRDPSPSGDGYSSSAEEPPGSAEVIDGPASRRPDEKMHEQRRSILIVDVSPTVRKIMRIGLERAGYKVVSASDGMQALARINEAIPDLIFVDIKLPHMDGYQLCRVIKSHGLTKGVPVVMLSGKAGVIDKMKIKMAGASDVITKPFGSDDLVGAVERYAR